jgi:hypothetical protein
MFLPWTDIDESACTLPVAENEILKLDLPAKRHL